MEAAARWRRLVRARLAEMERLSPGRGATGATFWNAPGRARRFHAAARAPERDPLFAKLRRASNPKGTVVDVGAGTGRFSLAIAPYAGEVVAVDPSRAMLGVLRREAKRRGLGNLRVIEAPWQDAVLSDGNGRAGDRRAVPPADVVVCSYVLPLVEDAAGFLGKMDAACRGRAFVYMGAASADTLLDPFWRHFHGTPRKPSPTYLDAAAVLRELGVDPDVEVVEVRGRARFDTLAAAVRAYRDMLLVPDTPDGRAELRELLTTWLVSDKGVLRPPLRTMPAAIISWRGRGRPESQADARARRH